MTRTTRWERLKLNIGAAINWALFLAMVAMLAGYLTGCGGGHDDGHDKPAAPCLVKQTPPGGPHQPTPEGCAS